MASKKESPIIDFTPEQVELIKRQIAPDATDDELQLFLYQCKRTGLDPFTRQIYCIHRKSGQKKKMMVQTSIDGFRVIAERSGIYGGQSTPVWEDVNGWPYKCTIAVYKFKGSMRYEAAIGVAYFKEYVQMTDEWKDGQRTGKKLIGDMWAKMPHTMIAKVAEALALRKAFPQDLSGLYTDDEMAQASNTSEATAESTTMQAPAQLPSPTSVPFTPVYTSQPEPVAVVNQSSTQQTAVQEQAAPTPTVPQTPFNKTYAEPAAIQAALEAAVTKKDVFTLYSSNKAVVDGHDGLKAAFKKRETQISTAGKLVISDSQFVEVCNKLLNNNLEAYQQALNVYVLSEKQGKHLDELYAYLLKVNEAISGNHDKPEELIKIVKACTCEAQVNTLHKNNAMLMDRDQEVATAVFNKLQSFKPAA